ncbi:MAG: nitroreductase family protein [Oscillospiraceae bacterium]|nr:nitroreductase family protein [Oscillospiraceae bacterium]
MNFLQLAKNQRFSVRKFKSQSVEKEKLDLILEAGRVAPTACNYQPQRILVIEDVSAIEKLKQRTSWHFDASVALIAEVE